MQAIKVMPEYGCFPLWHNDENEVGNIDPDSLPISSLLVSQLNEWAADFEATLNQEYPPDSGFNKKETEVIFLTKGYELASALKAELGTVTVTYFDIDQQRERSI
jgi:hypothetical protein